LVQDVDLFRQAIGADKLSAYGISYGTGVMATFATFFPDRVDKFLIDSNMPRGPSILYLAESTAQAQNANFQRMTYACENNAACKKDFGGEVQEGVEAVFAHLANGGPDNYVYFATYNDSETNTTVRKARPPSYLAQALYDAEQQANVKNRGLCYPNEKGGREPATCAWGWIGLLWRSLKAGDDEAFNKALTTIVPLDRRLAATALRRRRSQQSDGGNNDASYDDDYDDADGNNENNPACPGYACALKSGGVTSDAPMGSPAGYENTAQSLVLAQSCSNSCLNEDEFITAWKTIGARFTGMGSGWPAHMFAQSYALTYYFPNSRPVSPSGTPNLTGLIMGNIYDFATPYEWTQTQAEGFPSASLVTTTAMMHGVYGARGPVDTLDGDEVVTDPARVCGAYKTLYLMNGTLPRPGTTCLTDSSLFGPDSMRPLFNPPPRGALGAGAVNSPAFKAPAYQPAVTFEKADSSEVKKQTLIRQKQRGTYKG
jgi:hypothetical protein